MDWQKNFKPNDEIQVPHPLKTYPPFRLCFCGGEDKKMASECCLPRVTETCSLTIARELEAYIKAVMDESANHVEAAEIRTEDAEPKPSDI